MVGGWGMGILFFFFFNKLIVAVTWGYEWMGGCFFFLIIFI